MKMLELIRYDLPGELVELWCKLESPVLLPLQEMAIKRHGLFEKENLLVQAPTSSGKTFIGEMAAIQAALRRKKVVYLVPLKALAEEKFHDFQKKYEPYGLKVIISTRDRREFDADFEHGRFSIAVVVYEKLSQLIVRRPERLQEIELVIADELEILSDPERGPMAELLLTRILHAKVRLLGLSAVIGEADKLAQWMNASLVATERRPVELRYGVLHRGRFRFRAYNEQAEGEEEMLDVDSESPWEILTENLCHMVHRGETCLVFVKARHEARRGAELLAERIDLPAAQDSIESLRALEPTRSRESLLHTLNCGVAFHNADLSPAERKVVEDGFRQGEIQVIVSTSTLAVGLNLPAQNVFLSADKWRYDSRFGMPWKAPLPRAEYENMSGRAGRYGAGHPFGRSLLVAPTPFDEETMWRRYVEGERDRIEPQLDQEPLENHILQLVASRCCVTHKELLDLFESSLTGQWVWRESLTLDEVEFRIRTAANRAIDAGVLTSSPEGKFEATPLGKAVASKGVTIETAQALEKWLTESETRPWPDIDLVLAAALTQDGRMVNVALTSSEYEHADYLGKLKKLTAAEDLYANVPMNQFRNTNQMPFFEEVKAIKIGLFLQRWLEEVAVFDLEEEFHTTAGQILAAAQQISWLIDAAGAIAATMGAREQYVERILALAERVQSGLGPDAMALVRVAGPKLTRNAALALVGQQIHKPEALAKTSLDFLTKWMPRDVAKDLQKWAKNELKHEAAQTEDPHPNTGPILVIDDRHPGRIQLDGTNIGLQEKQYLLMRTLAAAPAQCVPYDTIYQQVWGEAIVENNQMHFQKRKLLDRIKEALPERARIITTIPKRGFMLNLQANDVTLSTMTISTAA